MKKLFLLLAPVVAMSVAACSSDSSSTGGGKTVIEPIGTPLITASAASPLTSETVTFSIGVTGGALQKGLLVWSDNCRGEFFAQSGTEVTWQNKWAEDCEIKAELYAAEPSAAAAAATDAAMASAFTIPAAVAVTDVTTKYAPGTVVTLAGNECSQTSGGYDERYAKLYGEDGPATEASFGRPYGVTISPTGEIVFSDREGGRVLKIDKDGILRRIAGPVLNNLGHTESGSGGLAKDAQYRMPAGLVYDAAGNLYVGNGYWSNAPLRKIFAGSTTTFTVLASTPGSQQMDRDDAGRIYMGNAQGTSLIIFYPSTGTTQSIATGASNWPYIFGVDATHDGATIYYSRRGDNQVYKYSGGVHTLVAGTGTIGYSGDGGPAVGATLNEPRGLYLDESTGNLFIADSYNQAIRMVAKNGTIKSIVKPGVNSLPGDGGVPATTLSSPSDLEMDANGDLIVADRHTCQIKKVVGPF